MSFDPGSTRRPVHVIDLAVEIDPLAALVVDFSMRCMARRLDHPVLHWRTRTQLLAAPPERVVAWGERAYAASRGAAVRGLYRPGEAAVIPPPSSGWKAAGESRAQISALVDAGWDAADCVLVRPPGIDARPPTRSMEQPLRSRLGIGRDEFLWLLPAEADRTSGQREAMWATAVLRTLERDVRAHRFLLHGSSPGHDRARRFVQQLGLPGLGIMTTRYRYHDLASIADAVLLLPTGPSCAWSAAVAALAGIPAVINRRPQVLESLGEAANVRIVEDDKPRVAVREMLRLSQSLPGRAPPAEQFSPAAVRRQWQEALLSVSEATG